MKQIESNKADRNLLAGEEIDLFAAQALLKFGERDSAAAPPSNDFPVQNEISGYAAKGLEKLGKFGDTIERAGVDLHLRIALVHLRANPIEFVFDQSAIGEGGANISG